MQFIDVVCIADDEHSVEVISTDYIKYSITHKISRKTATVPAFKVDQYWFMVHQGHLTTEVLSPDFALIADYCVNKYIEIGGDKTDKLCQEINKITSQPLDLDVERQTNAFIGRAWK